MNKEFDFLVYIGRFQPFHKGHYNVVQQALRKAENLIIIIGSAEVAPDIRNPFTAVDRMNIISDCLTDEEKERVHFVFQIDYMYNEDKWIASLQSAVNTKIHAKWRAGPYKIGIVGFDKDHTSYYLKKFPTWEYVEAEQKEVISATNIRTHYFKKRCFSDTGFNLSWGISANHMKNVLTCFESYPDLIEEYDFMNRYWSQWEGSPYPPSFNCADCVVTHAGCVLLVKRRSLPGKDLYALPGGFIEEYETIREAQLRELIEETKIDMPKAALVGSIVKDHIFDDPKRSLRGRTYSHACHMRLSDAHPTPKVRGSSDARNAFWMPLASLQGIRSQFFEDHFDIISYMLGI